MGINYEVFTAETSNSEFSGTELLYATFKIVFGIIVPSSLILLTARFTAILS